MVFPAWFVDVGVLGFGFGSWLIDSSLLDGLEFPELIRYQPRNLRSLCFAMLGCESGLNHRLYKGFEDFWH
jgi:hypothetical protein